MSSQIIMKSGEVVCLARGSFMNEYKNEQNVEMEVNVQRLVGIVWQKKWLIILVAVLSAIIVFLGTFYLITPKYESSAKFYVNNSSLSVGDASFSITSSDITAAKSLVDSYIVILQTRESLNDVIDYAGVTRTYEELKNMITAASVNSTEIFEVVVTSEDPLEAERIAEAIAYILPKRISSIIEGTSAKVVDAAVVPVTPSSPSYALNTLVGLVIGFVLAVAVIVLRQIFDITIHEEDDVTHNAKHPILASIPDMAAPTKGGYYYGYGNNKKKSHKKTVSTNKEPTLVGSDISFAASEAYKLLRTKLQFSFAGEGDSRVIGVSSALTGEGKSLSSVNVAYTLSQLDKRVLLIDCDMRRPSLAAKLPIAKVPGLSNYLSGQSGLNDLFQFCGIPGEEKAFTVIAAGRNPPNPVELLSSPKMSRMLAALREHFDYIILDLPPVGEVSDALAIAKQTDGMLLVVRQNYCNRIAFSSAVRQFEFVGARILGFVYNCVTENSGSYGKKYYKKYYNRSYGRYAAAERHARKAEQRAEEMSGNTAAEKRAVNLAAAGKAPAEQTRKHE